MRGLLNMRYLELYTALKNRVNYHDEAIDLGSGMAIRNFSFASTSHFDTEEEPGSEDFAIPDADPRSDPCGIQRQINKSDSQIEENSGFRYHLLSRKEDERVRELIIMFHGFNEKFWHKYLPWAMRIAVNSGKAVLLFPLAFHMNRAPALWSEPRAMNRISKNRRRLHPSVISSSLSNAAISTRLHNKPERFVWSGLQSYHDVMDLVEAARRNSHPAIHPDVAIDFFSYSVGTFLGQNLMMTDKNGHFSRSRYAMFCGGPVFNRLSPVSKFILDSEANVTLYSYLVEHLESHMKKNEPLNRLFGGEFEEGVNFRSLLSYQKHLAEREEKFKRIQNRCYAVALANDEVVPPYEVTNTLRGSRQNIGIQVDVLDFPYPYRHEDPFPPNAKIADVVDEAFRTTFDRIGEFYRG